MNTIRRRLAFIVLLVLTMLCALTYLPYFQVEGPDDPSKLRMPIMLASLGSFVLFFSWKCLRNRMIQQYIVLLMLIGLSYFIMSAFVYDRRFIFRGGSFMMYVLPLVALMIGYNSRMTRKQFVILSLTYIGFGLMSSFYQITTNIGGFVIEQQYFTYGKNSLGCFLMGAFALSVLLAITTKSKALRYVMIGACIASFIFCTTIRARTSMLGCGVFLLLALYISWKSGKQINHLRFILIFVAIAVVWLLSLVINDGVGGGLNNYIVSGFTGNRGPDADITSGRLNMYADALRIFSESPFFGNLLLQGPSYWTHNYLLLILSSYGLIGGIMFFVLYFKIVVTAIRRAVRIRIGYYPLYGYVVVLTLFFTSLSEPTFPYGPGTVTTMPFLLMGYSLSFSDVQSSYHRS